MLSYDQALAQVLACAQRLDSERISLTQACNRVLSEPVLAPASLPRSDTSAMDGYALRAADCDGPAPFRFRVLGESLAGRPLGRLEEGACRIFTGAWLPAGADCVVLQEDVQRTDEWITFSEVPKLFQNVRRMGEDVHEGQVVLQDGAYLGPFQLGLLASVEATNPLVTRRPRVAILCTGTELREPGSPDRQGSIPESNSVVLRAMAERAGAVVLPPSIVTDDRDATKRAIANALDQCDVLLTVGGVSVGDYDVVKDALASCGVDLSFWKVAIKPGKPLVLGTKGRQVVLGLPGNPVSAQVTFALFGLPLLRKMQGHLRPAPQFHSYTLTTGIRQAKGRRGFHRVTLDGQTATPLAGQSSGSVLSMALADGLAVVHESLDELAAKERVEVLRLADL